MSLPRVMQAIRRHRTFLVSAHVNPDLDALGSALALAGLLRKLGKRVTVLNDGGAPESVQFLPGAARVVASWPRAASADVAITVDVPTFSRVGTAAPWLKQAGTLISIDHHISHDGFGDINWVDPAAAATGQMIYWLFQAFKVAPSKDDALCMYGALVIDTGSFKYRNTTPEVHQVAADLLRRGRIDPLQVSQRLYETHHLRGLQTLGDILRGMRATADRRVAWVEVPERLVRRAGPEILDELVNYPRSIRTAEVAFALREHGPKNVRINLRSKGRVDVNRIARVFGGGGHMAASGCRIAASLPEARRRLLAEIIKHLPAPHGRSARR